MNDVIPWETLRPKLQAKAAAGVSLQSLADSIAMEYGQPVTAQTVRNHLEQKPAQPRPRTTDDLLAPLIEAAQGRPISRSEYQRWRATNPAPTAETIRRHYGTWNKALMAAALPTRRTREYGGLTRVDVILHIAHFLRSSNNHTKAAYRLWAKANPSAPSAETVRGYGSWRELVAEATQVEAGYRRSGTPLPTPQAVSTRGRRKSPIETVPL